MKITLSRMLTRPAFWPAAAVQLVTATQIWVAVQAAFAPGTSFRDQIWPFAVVFAAVITVFNLLSPLFLKAVLKDDERLSDEQTASMGRALRTGVLPLASLFADWGPALARCCASLCLAVGASLSVTFRFFAVVS